MMKTIIVKPNVVYSLLIAIKMLAYSLKIKTILKSRQQICSSEITIGHRSLGLFCGLILPLNPRSNGNRT